jgi:hypothetical protein
MVTRTKKARNRKKLWDAVIPRQRDPQTNRIIPRHYVAAVHATDCDYHVLFDASVGHFEVFKRPYHLVGTGKSQDAAIALAAKHAVRNAETEHQASVCLRQKDGSFTVMWLEHQPVPISKDQKKSRQRARRSA